MTDSSTVAGECRRAVVSGRVQGVFFRASTARQASRLGVKGWARNLPDGRVEVLACGQADAVDELIAWLWQGPPTAQVSSVRVAAAENVAAPAGFTTG